MRTSVRWRSRTGKVRVLSVRNVLIYNFNCFQDDLCEHRPSECRPVRCVRIALRSRRRLRVQRNRAGRQRQFGYRQSLLGGHNTITHRVFDSTDPLYFLLIIAAVVTAISGANWLLKRRRQSSANAAALASADESTSSSEQHLQPSTPPLAPPKPRRLRSLDTFRGIAIVLMIFVNSGGGHYWWMEHATWNGLHVADTVFPCFLWIMGVCVPMSVRAQLTRGRTRRAIVGQVAVVSVVVRGFLLVVVHPRQFVLAALR